jgi:hypothetical protein
VRRSHNSSTLPRYPNDQCRNGGCAEFATTLKRTWIKTYRFALTGRLPPDPGRRAMPLPAFVLNSAPVAHFAYCDPITTRRAAGGRTAATLY